MLNHAVCLAPSSYGDRCVCCFLRYKYILAYLPLVAFYYRGKTLFKFRLESSFEDLRDMISNVTGTL